MYAMKILRLNTKSEYDSAFIAIMIVCSLLARCNFG